MKVSAFLRGNNVLAESILLVEIPYKSKLPLHEFSFVKATAPFFHVIGDVGEAVE